MNWKTPVTMLVLLGILLGAAYYGWSTIVTPDEKQKNTTTKLSEKGPVQRCGKDTQFKKGQVVKARDILVNVYNAGVVSGLAVDTLDALTSKGFQRGVASNAPGSTPTSNVTILTNDPESPEVRLVRIQFRGLVKVVKGELSPGIDVLVGDDFLAVNPSVDTQITLRRSIKTCSPNHG